MKLHVAWIPVCLLSALFTREAAARDWIVDTAHPAAADDNPGTREAPLKTIGAAALKTEPGDRVLVRPGIYREAVSVGISGRPDAPIVFESEVPHAAIVSGSDPAPADQWTEVEPGVWQTPWPDLDSPWWPLKPNYPGQWVYADGAPLLKVMSAAELMPGRFWLDFEGKTVNIMLPEARTPANTMLELARRDGLFRAGNWRDSQRLKPDSPWITDIVIRGFMVVHNADWFRGFASIRVTGERWRVENNHIRMSSRMGLQATSSRDCVVRGNTVEWAGVTCVGGTPNLDLRFENNTVRTGNFRRNIPGEEGGGSKFLGTLDGVFSGNRFEANYGSGLWFDGGNAFNVIRNNRSTDNFVFGGFFSEIGWHDAYADNVSAYNEIGFLIGETPAAVLYRNIICGNSNWGIRMRGNYRREAGATLEELEAKLQNLGERIPNFPAERLEWRRYHLLQYVVATPYRLLNNCAIVDNLVFDNKTAYVEYRLYGDPANAMAPFVQNFSDYNLFWPRDESQLLITGPAGYVYPDGLAGWQAASNRDQHSIVADPRDPATSLPEWCRDHPFLKEPRLRLNTDLADLGLNIVQSPETALLYERLRRAATLTPIALPVPLLRACRFRLDDEDWVALWNTEEGGRQYVNLRVEVPEVVVEDAYGLRRTLRAEGGLLELGLDYRPVFLRAFSGSLTPVALLRWDVRRFNAMGSKVPMTITLFNEGAAPVTFRANVHSGAGFRAEPGTLEATIPAGQTVTLDGALVPEGSSGGALARVRIEGRYGAMPFCRFAQFAIGEGAGTIQRATTPIRVDGRTGDWGDLAARVPLVELADFARDGLDGADAWSGPRDLSAVFHAAWSKKGLYWLVLVRDDAPLACPEGVMAYAMDAVELFIDGRSTEMQWDPRPDEGTAQLIVTPAMGDRPSSTYRRPADLPAEFATGVYDGGYLIEGFIPFDPGIFPAGEWEPGRTLKLALQVLDRDDTATLGTGQGLCKLAWGATRDSVKDKKTGREITVTRTHASTAGWKTLVFDE